MPGWIPMPTARPFAVRIEFRPGVSRLICQYYAARCIFTLAGVSPLRARGTVPLTVRSWADRGQCSCRLTYKLSGAPPRRSPSRSQLPARPLERQVRPHGDVGTVPTLGTMRTN